MARIAAVHLLFASALAALGAGPARAFEGTVTLRTVSVPRAALAALHDGKTPDAQQIFAMLPAQLLAAKGVGAEVRETTVYVSGPKVRMDAPLERDKSGYALVDIDQGTTWFVVPEEKRYIEWSKADAKAMGDKMVEVRKTLQARLAQLPPEQRAQAEEMLKNMPAEPAANAPPPAPIALTALDRTLTINGMPATAYEASEHGATVIGWVTQAQPKLAAALRAVAERMEQMTPANMRKASVRASLQQKGLPVMVQTLEPTRYRIEEVLAVDQKPVPADLLAVPKGYTRTTGRDALRAVPAP